MYTDYVVTIKLAMQVLHKTSFCESDINTRYMAQWYRAGQNNWGFESWHHVQTGS